MKFGFLLGELGFPPAKPGFPLGQVGFLVCELSLVLRSLGFSLRNLGFSLRNLGFPIPKLGHLLRKRGCPLSELGFLLLQPPIPIAKLGVPPAEVGVLLDVSNQLLLNQVDEDIDFLLAITTLADARPRERDIVNISRSESHCSFSRSLRRQENVKAEGVVT